MKGGAGKTSQKQGCWQIRGKYFCALHSKRAAPNLGPHSQIESRGLPALKRILLLECERRNFGWRGTADGGVGPLVAAFGW